MVQGQGRMLLAAPHSTVRQLPANWSCFRSSHVRPLLMRSSLMLKDLVAMECQPMRWPPMTCLI